MKTNIYPVIHVLNMDVTHENVKMCIDNECDGVFLIHMNGQDEVLSNICLELKSKYKDLKIGINRLSRGPSQSFYENNQCGSDFTWVDYCGIMDGSINSIGECLVDIKSNNPSHKIFGGISFKYQKVDNNPIESAKLAVKNGFIATTTGQSTGNAPDLQKISNFSSAVGRENLAIASGITPENIKYFHPLCQNFLVATGISKDFYRFDVDKLSLLVKNSK